MDSVFSVTISCWQTLFERRAVSKILKTVEEKVPRKSNDKFKLEINTKGFDAQTKTLFVSFPERIGFLVPCWTPNP